MLPDYQLGAAAREAGKSAKAWLARGYGASSTVAKATSGRAMSWLRVFGRFVVGWSRCVATSPLLGEQVGACGWGRAAGGERVGFRYQGQGGNRLLWRRQ